MDEIVESKSWRISGFIAFVAEVIVAVAIWRIARQSVSQIPWRTVALIVLTLIFVIAVRGFFVVHPNEAKVVIFFGRYVGSVRQAGWHWTNPFTNRKSVSVRVRNFNSEIIKVNDETGNPIEIGAVVVWNVTDSARALFNVDDYESFVSIQAETAIRNLASNHPYDTSDNNVTSLRGNQELVAENLSGHLTDRLNRAGVAVVEARISHLAYAPEIAQTMLRRQQAAAIISARQLIVDGAVGMVRFALQSLEESGVVKLDEERKASMVNNLLVTLVSERESQPVVNTGTLYA
ncbi:MAG TPA: SPFH domain-containing protein [Spirochaetia bacterium]|nr:SPFH domain-containing protein [Spirochaetia bacterium]